MADAAQDNQAPEPTGGGKSALPSAAAGALGGTAISMALFTTLHVEDVIRNPLFGPDYALMIFSIVALAIFLAGILTLPGKISSDRRGIVIAGFSLVGLLAIGSAAPFVLDSLRHPTIKIQGALQPDLSHFVDDDTIAPVKLSAELDNEGQNPVPLGAVVGQIFLNTANPLTVTVVHLSDLMDKYKTQRAELTNERQGASQKKSTIDQLCSTVSPQEQRVCLFLKGASHGGSP